MRDPRERIRDVLEAIGNVERYVSRGRAAFEQDELLQTWFVRQLQVIGEAVRGIPEEVRALAPDVPWPKIVGMRHVLVHGYFEIDTAIVWDAVATDVPALKEPLERLLKRLG